ncbi:MAG TPA: putative baseplate assembly protein [Xanthobacteraceae bacterium]|nr:putative baseplate assembly protein [Xanthobacteraceae bacterium]
MPLIPPALDDRSYDDLVQEMLASIPAHTPEWTSIQPGDPGRTLIELFAWLADTILYRANLIPERQRIAFLRLLGLPLRPAAAATGIISLGPDASTTSAVTVAAGATVSGPPNFETLGEVDVLPISAQAYVKAPLTASQQATALPLLTGLKSLYSLPAVPTGYTTTPVFVGNAADPKGVDLIAGSIDQCIWFALLAGKPENLAATRATLGGAQGQRVLNLGFVPSLPASDPLAGAGTLAPVPATWQLSGSTRNFVSLSVVDDTTSGLTRPGVVRLALPQGTDIGAPPNDVLSDAQAGVGAKPPRIDDPNIDGILVAWIRVHVESAVSLSWAGVNAVAIDQRTTKDPVVIGVSSGAPGQIFPLSQTQIDPATFALDVDMPGLGYQLWQAVDDLAVLQGPIPAYVLDPEAGTATFGNQMQGLIPPAGRRIRVRRMRVGGGSAGNLPAGSLTKVAGNDVSGQQLPQFTVNQPLPTSDGDEPETLDEAERRLPARLRHQDRAVTASDYEDLALAAPGALVERAEALPLFKPQTRDFNAPGVVSVMVLPAKDGVQPPCPRADRTLLESVYAYLDPRRAATAEMYVIGTEYVGLGISVAVEVGGGFELLQVGKDVELALRNYLWPLAPGGPANVGWPLGRTVRSLELEVTVGKVAGVVEVNGLRLFQPLPSGDYQLLPADASEQSELTLASWQLPELLQVRVVTGADGSGIAVPTSLTPDAPTDPNTVAVPIVAKVC